MNRAVVIFAEDYLPNIGGISTHVHNLAQSLNRADCKVVVITTRKIKKTRNLFHWKVIRKVIDGVRVIEIPMIYSPRNILRAFQFKYRFGRIVNMELKKMNAKVFHWHNVFFDPEVAKLVSGQGIIKVFTNHSSQFLLAEPGSKQYKYNQGTLKLADYIITPSTELKEMTIKSGFSAERVVFISNGVNTSLFCPDAKSRNNYREKLGIGITEIAIICPRRVVPKCGVIYLAKALKYIETDKPIKVFFTGLSGGSLTWRDAEYEEEVKEFLLDRPENVNVVPLGQIPNSEMNNYYRAMDICVLPSLIEATSISGLEAMSTGLPIVATNVGGLPEIITHGVTGLLVPKEREIELAESLSILINDSKLRLILGQNGRTNAKENFEWNVIAKKTLEIYNLPKK